MQATPHYDNKPEITEIFDNINQKKPFNIFLPSVKARNILPQRERDTFKYQ